jgi:hypothetical protein
VLVLLPMVIHYFLCGRSLEQGGLK